jgi:hypothetical protein
MDGLRSLVLREFECSAIGRGFLVVAVAGLLAISLNVRIIRNYD